MSACIRADRLSLDVPIFLQHEREAKGWANLFLGAAFDPPRRRLVRLLEDISLDIREGDRVAILGRNGAGKSTLLRVLNRVYQPTSGQLVVQGSCQALLNMSLGFNGEATVRENIFLRGIAVGLKSSYLRHQIDPILEFSGLHDKAAHRLHTLSSGQKMRLGFAISTSVQHDIILMDEWVGAGDAEFMAKAKERMLSRVGGSKIVVLASHSTGLLREICNKGVVLEQGKVIHYGDIISALKCYHDMFAKLRNEKIITIAEARSNASVYGFVESIANEGDKFLVKGWFVDTEGAVPGGLVLEVNGRRYSAENIEKVTRVDVMQHMGLSNPNCGFHAVVTVPDAVSLNDLGSDLKVYGGDSPEHADTPLQIANNVALLLAPPSPAVYGFVESIAGHGDSFVITGWFIDTEGEVPTHLVMQVHGQRYIADNVAKIKRPDVVKHLGLRNDDCGFRAVVTVPGAFSLPDLGVDLQVFGGHSLVHADSPLRIAASVASLLPAHVEMTVQQ